MSKRAPMRERILDAAEDLSGRLGWSWTLGDAARASGVSRASLYRHFSSRQKLLEALSEERGIEWDARAFMSPKERILEAVVEVSARCGLARTTLEAVAREARVGEATIYRHFGDRKGLLQAYADAKTPRALLLQLSPETPLKEGLFGLCRSAIQLWLEHGPFLLAGLSQQEEALVGHLRQLEADSRGILAGYLDAKIARGALQGEGKVLAGALVGLVAGVVLQDPLAAGQDLDATATTIVELFLHGASHEEQP